MFDNLDWYDVFFMLCTLIGLAMLGGGAVLSNNDLMGAGGFVAAIAACVVVGRKVMNA